MITSPDLQYARDLLAFKSTLDNRVEAVATRLGYPLDALKTKATEKAVLIEDLLANAVVVRKSPPPLMSAKEEAEAAGSPKDRESVVNADWDYVARLVREADEIDQRLLWLADQCELSVEALLIKAEADE